MQIAIAIAISVVILAITLWVVRLLLVPQPGDYDPDAMKEISMDYRCIVCGMRLTITQAQNDNPEAPRHCHEEMAEVP